MRPMEALEWDDGIALASIEHCNDIGPRSVMSYQGSQNNSSPTSRVLQFGEGEVGWENLAFGIKSQADEVIMSMFVSDG